MKIILDAMGGDNAPQAPVTGALQAVKDFGAQIILVGRTEEIMQVVKENGLQQLPAGLEIQHADDVVDMHDDPALSQPWQLPPENRMQRFPHSLPRRSSVRQRQPRGCGDRHSSDPAASVTAGRCSGA